MEKSGDDVQNRAVLLFLLLIALGVQSYAQLGAKIPTAELSAAKSRSSKVFVYDVRESTVDGVLIKEYFSNNGIVFALSWRGVAAPDLTHFLGAYFPEYDQAAREQLPVQRRGKSATITSSQITVRKFGHMRDIRGVATVPSLMPAGVQAEDLQ